MPMSGTHITIVQRLTLDPALSPALRPLLGNPDPDPAVTAPPGSPEYDPIKYDPAGALRMKYANLGAVGPDLLYALLDYGGDWVDLENFMIKVSGTFKSLGDLMEEINGYVTGTISSLTWGVSDSIRTTSTLLNGIVKESILGMLVTAGFNFWARFGRPPRQDDRPRTEWFWADYLHYVRSGQFARRLLEITKVNLDGDPTNDQLKNLYAYALGYLTHYVVDVVGHPYVNQVVQSPWRMYWQRHHLVENFIDAYVWERWHLPFGSSSADEPPLDRATTVPNAIGAGAPATYARLHDHISIGGSTLDPALDGIIDRVCDSIRHGLFDLGAAEFDASDIPPPSGSDFDKWSELVETALKDVYLSDPNHPTNLVSSPTDTGLPSKEDIATAFGAMCLALKVTTESKIQEPLPPDIIGDVSQAVDDMMQDVQDAIAALQPPPVPSISAPQSIDDLIKAIENAARAVADSVEKVIEVTTKVVEDAVKAGTGAVTDSIKFALYLLNKSLFALYRVTRDVLVLNAYGLPYPEDLLVARSSLLLASDLWCSPGNLGSGAYPREEQMIIVNGQPVLPEREDIHPPAASYPAYSPLLPPLIMNTAVEQPAVDWAAPYHPAPGNLLVQPDAFIEGPRGPDNMFSALGVQPGSRSSDTRAPNTYASTPRNFGGALANCEWAILHWEDSGFDLPDYNLDADRGYAWPCWDVEPMVHQDAPAADKPQDKTDPKYVAAVGDPLSPDDPRNLPGVAHVNAGPAN